MTESGFTMNDSEEEEEFHDAVDTFFEPEEDSLISSHSDQPSPPIQIIASEICSDSVSLQWDTPAGEVLSYTVTRCSEGKTVQELSTDSNSLTFSCLKPGVCYSFHVSAQLKNGTQTKQTVTSVKTKSDGTRSRCNGT
ncbi:myomesin-3-like [Oreochromis niloticus]|uniref:myomesin-3-like n=1 Tax=Oreochromis niloticus TaxID=8128 RepID=UPI0009055568|nr:myomesin-3-like [Oreochromis niloticus]